MSDQRLNLVDTEPARTDELVVLQGLSAAAAAFTGSERLESVLDQLLSSMLHVSQADAGSIMLLSTDGEWLRVVAAQGPLATVIIGTQERVGQSVAGWALREKRTVTLHGRASAESGHPRDLSSAVITPLRVGGRFLGVLNASRGAGSTPLDERSVRLLGLLANQAAILIDNAQMMEREHAALRERAQLLDLAHEAIVMRDLATGLVSFWNTAARQLYGWTSVELPTEPLHAFASTTFPQAQAEIEAELMERDRWQGELSQRRCDGAIMFVDSRWALYRDPNGTPIGVLEVNSDVTHRKQTEEQLRAALAKMEAVDRTKTEFVSTVSHELRTPLTSINGYIDLFLDGELGALSAEQRKYLRVVRGNGDRLLALINDLLDTARLASGAVKLKYDSIDLVALIEQVATSLRPQIAGKSQTLMLNLPGSLPAVRGDANRLTQVLTNLLSNAQKYTPPHGHLCVGADLTDTMLRVDVSDTGIGLSEDEQAQLFTKFFRADNPAVRQVGGTGLGLVITRSLVELHGGTLTLKSAPGEGSTFSFTVPVAQPTTDAKRWLLTNDQGELRAA